MFDCGDSMQLLKVITILCFDFFMVVAAIGLWRMK